MDQLMSGTVMSGERLDLEVPAWAVAISKARTVFIAVGTGPYEDRADEVIRQPVGTALPELLRRLSTGSDA